MDSLLFSNSNRRALLLIRKFGFPMPWIVDRSDFSKLFYSYHDKVYLSVLVYLLICCVFSLTVVEDTRKDLNAVPVLTVQVLTATSVGFIFLKNQNKINLLIKDMDDLTRTIMNSSKEMRENFVKINKDNSKKLTKISLAITYFTMFSTIQFTICIPILEAISGKYGTSFAVPMATGIRSRLPVLYEVNVFIHVLALFMSANKKATTDVFFLILFRLQLTFTKHLTLALKELEQSKSESVTAVQLNAWIQMHQRLVKNKENLVGIYAPILVIYYVNLIYILTNLMLFLKNDNFIIIQAAATAQWLFINVLLLYLQCYTASNLAEQSQEMAVEAYCLPHYQLGREIGDKLRLIILMANNPSAVTAYKSPIFEINKESFVQFSASVISTFMALYKILGYEAK